MLEQLTRNGNSYHIETEAKQDPGGASIFQASAVQIDQVGTVRAVVFNETGTPFIHRSSEQDAAKRAKDAIVAGHFRV